MLQVAPRIEMKLLKTAHEWPFCASNEVFEKSIAF